MLSFNKIIKLHVHGSVEPKERSDIDRDDVSEKVALGISFLGAVLADRCMTSLSSHAKVPRVDMNFLMACLRKPLYI